MAEFGPCFFCIFNMLMVPLLALGTIGVRYVFLLNAARLAAGAGSQCKTFITNTSSTELSATNLATSVATKAVTSFSGISLTKVTCYIVSCPISGSSVTRQTTVLTTAPDSSANAYDFEVVLTGQIQPLFYTSTKFLASIPGLSAPVVLTTRTDVIFENSQGLTK